MCGIAGIFGRGWETTALQAMVDRQRHRGPDSDGIYRDPSGVAGLGNNRLSVIEPGPSGRQPMCCSERRFWLSFNGEIYNYLELRAELSDYPFRTRTDTEVVLAAYRRWGEGCLERFIGMFSFLIWDERNQSLFGARDRFGVKPLYYHLGDEGSLVCASEISALHAAGVVAEPDATTWATYLAHGLCDHAERTFWEGIRRLPPGHCLGWRDGRLSERRWYDLAEEVGPEPDRRPEAAVRDEYVGLLHDAVALRFRSDVPVGINLSGGLDSATLLGLVQRVQGPDSDVKAFTFVTGDARYDELPWVETMLRHTRHGSVVCRLDPADVPGLATSVQDHQSEPFGGVPTLAYARLCERAREEGTIVLLDGQGMDEQWAGYDYYRAALNGGDPGIVQGTQDGPVRPGCLTPEFARRAEELRVSEPFPDALQNAQYRDVVATKIPRALRFNDRVSMRASTELREPFLDHRLVELALRQPAERKLSGGVSKVFLRNSVADALPGRLVEAPKRALQTPQREWLRGELVDWSHDLIQAALKGYGDSWLDPSALLPEWDAYRDGASDNSFYVWQWIGLGMTALSRQGVPGGR